MSTGATQKQVLTAKQLVPPPNAFVAIGIKTISPIMLKPEKSIVKKTEDQSANAKCFLIFLCLGLKTSNASVNILLKTIHLEARENANKNLLVEMLVKDFIRRIRALVDKDMICMRLFLKVERRGKLKDVLLIRHGCKKTIWHRVWVVLGRILLD